MVLIGFCVDISSFLGELRAERDDRQKHAKEILDWAMLGLRLAGHEMGTIKKKKGYQTLPKALSSNTWFTILNRGILSVTTTSFNDPFNIHFLRTVIYSCDGIRVMFECEHFL